jgi:hypothetical protein
MASSAAAAAAPPPKYYLLNYTYVPDILEKRGPHRYALFLLECFALGIMVGWLLPQGNVVVHQQELCKQHSSSIAACVW